MSIASGGKRARGHAKCTRSFVPDKWDPLPEGTDVPTIIPVIVSASSLATPVRRGTYLFYFEDIEPEWRKLQRPFKLVKRVYNRPYPAVSPPYEEEHIFPQNPTFESSSDEEDDEYPDVSEGPPLGSDDPDAAGSSEYRSGDEGLGVEADVEDSNEETDAHRGIRERTMSAADALEYMTTGILSSDIVHEYLTSLETEKHAAGVESCTKRHLDSIGTSSQSPKVSIPSENLPPDADVVGLQERIARLEAENAVLKARGKRPLE